MRNDQCRPSDVPDDVRHRERLAAARNAHQNLRADAVQHPFRQLFDRLRLIARRRKRRMQFEFMMFHIHPSRTRVKPLLCRRGC